MSPYGGSDGGGATVFSSSPSSVQNDKKKRRRKNKKKKVGYRGSPTSSEGSSPPRARRHENISGILPIDAYMAATEDKIQMEKRRLKDYKRTQRKIHSELVEQNLRHRAYVKQSKSVSPKQRRRGGRARGRRSPTRYPNSHDESAESAFEENRVDEDWDQGGMYQEGARGRYEDDAEEDHVGEERYGDPDYLYESRRRKTDRRRRERGWRSEEEEEEEDGSGTQTVFLKESRDGSPGQLLDAAEYRRLRELERWVL